MKKIGLGSLLYTGIGSIVGSGWLMSPYLIAKVSGPASLLSWVFGAIIISIIALNFMEVCAFLPPKDGGFGHYVGYTHNSFLSFIVEWVFLLSWISLIPAEATATVQYLGGLYPKLEALIVNSSGTFSIIGTLTISAVCLIFFIINYMSMSLLMKLIKYLTLFKILIPIVVAGAILFVAHHFSNLGFSHNIGHHSGFMPYGYHGLLGSITAGGVVFAFNGFQTPITFAGQVSNPKKTIPLAILLSVIFCTVIYLVLQLAYLLAIPSEMLTDSKSWAQLVFNAPFIDISNLYNLNFITNLLSIAAFIAPFGAGLVYYASSVKITSGFSAYLPKLVSIKNKNGLPIGSITFVLIIALGTLWLLPGWQEIVSVICVSLVILFAVICAVNGSLSQYVKVEKKQNGIYIKGSKYFAMLGYILASLMYFWSAWPLTGKGMIVILCGLPIYLIFHSKNHGLKSSLKTVLWGSWLIIHFILITCISYLSTFGGIGIISSDLSQVIIVFVSVVFYVIGIRNSKLKLNPNLHLPNQKED